MTAPPRPGDRDAAAALAAGGAPAGTGVTGAYAAIRADAPPLRLLVVDDDSVDRLAVRRALARARIAAELDEAAGAPEALERLAAGSYDCVLLDYNIPGGDGLTLLKGIRGAGLHVPVVMLTGHGDEQVAVELMKAGAVDYLPKASFTPERLAASLRHAVELSRAVEAARAAEEELRASAARARFLAEASATLADARDLQPTLERVVRLALPLLGDYCLVYLTHADGTPMAVVSAHRDPAMEPAARLVETSYRPRPDDPHSALAAAIRTGRTVHLAVVPDAHLAGITGPDAATLAALRALGPTTVLVVPLVARGQVLGAIAFSRTTPGATYVPLEVELAEDLARRAATALDNARLLADAERARAEAVEANRAKSEFLARMSHDLRTPLNAIGGYAQLVDMGVHGPVTDAQREAMGRIGRAQQHLLALINDILSFARLEAGQVHLVLGPVPVDALLGEVAELIEPQAAARGVGVRYLGPPAGAAPAVAATADRERLTQVLLNLLGNAVKFTEPGGLVTLAWREEGDAIALEVRDTGRGIPRERLQAIFDPFVQVEREPEDRRTGVGLGLAISRELARGMGGAIDVDSTPGHGSVFTVRLPRAEPGARG